MSSLYFSSYLISKGSARVRESRAARSESLSPSRAFIRACGHFSSIAQFAWQTKKKERSDYSQTTKPDAHNKKPKGYELFHQIIRYYLRHLFTSIYFAYHVLFD